MKLEFKLWWINLQIFIIKKILMFQESATHVKAKLERIHQECIDRILKGEEEEK